MELLWWSNFSQKLAAPVSIKRSEVDHTINTDASMLGWGACSSTGIVTHGCWTNEEKSCHINFLELKAI